MTVGQALERAEELRPGSRIALATRQAWLAQTLHGTTACRTTMCCWHRHLLMRCIRIICVP